MSHDDARSTTATVVVRRPFHTVLVSLAAACFIGTLLSDITYWQTAEMMWADFSAWLVSVGVVIGWLAVIVGLIDWATGRFRGLQAPVLPWVIATLLALILATLDMFIHSRDAWTSVVPWGLALSAAVVVILLIAGWIRSSATTYRTSAGVIR